VSARDKVTFLESLLERVRRNAAQPRQRGAAAPPPAAAAPAPAAEVPAPLPVRERVVAPPVLEIAPPSSVQPPPETVKVEEPARHEVAIPPVSSMSGAEPDTTVEVVDVEELDEAEIVDITLEDELDAPAPPPPPVGPPPAPSTLAAAAAAAGKSDIDFEEEDDRPPSSSRRPKLTPTSLDDALSASQLDDEHEVPIKTPPPESGPQEALPPPQVLQQPPLELDEPGMEAELARAAGPAPEQVGNTIELEEPAGPSLELDSLPAESGPQLGRTAEELEADLAPSRQPTPVPVAPIESEPAPELTSAVVPVSAPLPVEPPISVPAEARSVPAEPRSVPAETLSLPAEPISIPAKDPHVEQLLPPVATHVEPEIVKRPALPAEVQVPVFVRAHREFAPSTFVELLDASLGLGS
jgi:hypothetical protein